MPGKLEIAVGREVTMRPKIGIALGSGGLRGLSHIGVLRVLRTRTDSL